MGCNRRAQNFAKTWFSRVSYSHGIQAINAHLMIKNEHQNDLLNSYKARQGENGSFPSSREAPDCGPLGAISIPWWKARCRSWCLGHHRPNSWPSSLAHGALGTKGWTFSLPSALGAWGWADYSALENAPKTTSLVSSLFFFDLAMVWGINMQVLTIINLPKHKNHNCFKDFTTSS